MEKLAKKMELKMEQFLLTRLIRFNMNKEMQLTFRGTDIRGFPYSFLKTVVVKSKEVRGEPYKINMKN